MPEPVQVHFLGGIGEIGRNCTAIEQSGRVLLVDCGVMFPPHERDDFLLPSLGALEGRAGDIEGVVLTHGHLDHIGGLPQLVKALGSAPDRRLRVHGSTFSLALAKERLAEYRAERSVELIPFPDGFRRRIGPFKVETLAMSHSVPSAQALAIRTEQGLILHTGDFKLDPAPIDGRVADLERVAGLAAGDGIRLLLSDSTNACEEGASGSESEVADTPAGLVAERTQRRIVVACFASNIHRVASVVRAAVASGRKVALAGRSLERNIALAESCGLVALPTGTVVSVKEIGDYPPEKMCVIVTGAQGEGRSALSRIARGDFQGLRVAKTDTVILSSSVIPGNETAVATMIGRLRKRGASVLTEDDAHVHVSGHACRDELAAMLRAARPRFFVPVHGTDVHLAAHGEIAEGCVASRVVVPERGATLVLEGRSLELEGVAASLAA